MSHRTAKRQRFYAAQRVRRARRAQWRGLKGWIAAGIRLPTIRDFCEEFWGAHRMMLDAASIATYGTVWLRGGKRIDLREVYLPANEQTHRPPPPLLRPPQG